MRWDEMKVLQEIFCWLESPVAPLNVPLHIRQWDENARRWRQRRRLGGDVWSRPTMIPTRVLLMCLFVDITILRFFRSFFPFPSFVVVVVRSDDSDDSAERQQREREVNYQAHIFQLLNLASFTHRSGLLHHHQLKIFTLSIHTMWVMFSWMYVCFWSKIKISF